MRTLIFSILTVCFWNNLVLSQSEIYIPGGLDFASRILGNYSIPIPTLGYEGALRNPADYGIGINMSRAFYTTPITNYLGWTNPDWLDTEELTAGVGLEYVPDSSQLLGFRAVFGYHIDQGIEGVTRDDDIHPTSSTLAFGFAFPIRLSDWGKLNIGLVKYAPTKNDFLVWRIDYGIGFDIFEHLKINYVYRNVTSYSKDEFYAYESTPLIIFPDEVISSSWAVYYTIEDFQVSLLGKLYSHPDDINYYTPLLHFGYKFLRSKELRSYFGIVELFIGDEGKIVFGINCYGLTLQIGKNKYGTSYNLVWIFGFVTG